ncbi:AI-2E family transporter [Duganella sp. BJB488]|uniref:AI-2E family transporter n=1 Tax=unclassified Duganella TaxID=2636909 RepID=UPI000E349334|nr:MULTISPECIES: AI-2E family transporter [unclassified Duganella]RFP09903.1 AI-2E family transporter [Duganella sp. BJB489]RFP13438.1 AI-2E family transporter [Duganella sp. BJB488]RFP29472.1 AI-2E family transporter [Duganella sp. BJB480]
MNFLPTQQRAGPVVWSGIIAATCVLLFLLQQMLFLAIPFLLGIVLYYILQPPMQRLIRMGLSHNASTMIVGGVFLLLLAMAGLVLIFWDSGPSDSWQDMLGKYLTGGLEFVRHTMLSLEREFPILKQIKLARTVNSRVSAFTGTFVQKHLTDILVSVAAWLPSLLLAPFLTFFFLRDGLRFKKFLARAVPNAFFEKTLCLLHEVDQTAHRYFQGLIKLTILDTAVLAIGLWAIGVSSPLVLGLIAAMLAWVPYVGSIVGCMLVVMVASTDAPADPAVAYMAIGVFIAVRLLDDFVFMPMTLGRSLHIHPLITVLMIFIGGSVAGVAGLMLVLPLLGVVMVIGETLGRLITDPRLRARHRNAMELRTRQASADLT